MEARPDGNTGPLSLSVDGNLNGELTGMEKTRSTLWLSAAALLALMLIGCSEPNGTSPVASTPPDQAALTATEQTQLTVLEARPLAIPPMPADAICHSSASVNISPYRNGATTLVYGGGPIYAIGGHETDTAQVSYFDVTVVTDPTVHGVVLGRGKELDGRRQIIYVGRYAAGTIVGTDSLDGKATEQHAELALPADRPPSNAGVAPGWAIWKVRQGVGVGSNGCYGFQFDTASGTESLLVYNPSHR
jgi:hypothetical protein